MSTFGLKKQIDLVQAYRRALLALVEQCKDVADAMHLRIHLHEEKGAAFGAQETDDDPLRVTLPRWEVAGGELTVKFQADAMQQDTSTGFHTGLVWVDRFRKGGRMDCPAIWTPVEAVVHGEVEWYEGARGNTAARVTDETVRRWFTVFGSKPVV